MKKMIILFLIIYLSSFSFAYMWENVGPSDLQVNNFNTVFYNILVEILCSSDGILINEEGNWVEYPYSGLPAWKAIGLDPNNILVLLGDGSWSDGIYKFNLSTHQFDITEWIPFPNFMLYCTTNNTYYAGGLYGMWESTDGMNWSEIVYFSLKDCVAMAYFENHFVVSADNEIYYSHDSGATWNLVQPGSPLISDLAFHANGTLYGIFPGPSNSSGLWSSNDFGESWNVEFYSNFMSSVELDAENNIFVGWELPGTDGFASWDPINLEFEFFNDGLPNFNINKITYNPYIESLNIVCCTDSGAYMLTDYVGVGIEDKEVVVSNYKLGNYPNPFNPTGADHSPGTTICFTAEKAEDVENAEITIYNIKGQKVKTLRISNTEHRTSNYESVTWDGTDENNHPISSGVYLYQLKVDGKQIDTKRCLLLK
ncbi:MAG: gliding motility-associated C-terminal domain-containing protein [Candidatus Cloacimonetes bacterium]|nr:gliding motility-associated C-terminal domain-containing protein [Candidatus Cloacimonadota bacterium]